MKEQTNNFVKYILEKNGIKTGYSIEALCAHAELLEERQKLLMEKKDFIDKYEPILTIGQRLHK